MRTLQRVLVPAVLFLSCVPMFGGPRDAAAVMNRCGTPTLGDTTIYESHTIAGGRRILKYIRGTVNFNRVQNDGWTFTFGEHGKLTNLTADQMSEYMPCLKQALIDSASDAPLTPITSAGRVEASVKGDYKQIILIALGALAVLVVIYGVSLLRRKPEDEN